MTDSYTDESRQNKALQEKVNELKQLLDQKKEQLKKAVQQAERDASSDNVGGQEQQLL